MDKVFSVPGRQGIIDVAFEREDGVLVGFYSHETLEEIALRYPCVILNTRSEAQASQEASFITSPKEITEEQFIDALDVLPPMNWRNEGRTESFKFCEYIVDNITNIYVRVSKRYFHFSDRDRKSVV